MQRRRIYRYKKLVKQKKIYFAGTINTEPQTLTPKIPTTCEITIQLAPATIKKWFNPKSKYFEAPGTTITNPKSGQMFALYKVENIRNKPMKLLIFFVTIFGFSRSIYAQPKVFELAVSSANGYFYKLENGICKVTYDFANFGVSVVDTNQLYLTEALNLVRYRTFELPLTPALNVVAHHTDQDTFLSYQDSTLLIADYNKAKGMLREFRIKTDSAISKVSEVRVNLYLGATAEPNRFIGQIICGSDLTS